MHKRGIQLGVNMIVVIIISLVILSMGIVLLRNFITGAEELELTLNERTAAQLESLLYDENQLIAMSRNTIKLRGEEQDVLGIGVLNIGSQGTFQMDIDNPPRLVGGNPADGISVLYDDKQFTLQAQESKIIQVLVTVDQGTERGTYVSDVTVYKGSEKYDSMKKLYVVVE